MVLMMFWCDDQKTSNPVRQSSDRNRIKLHQDSLHRVSISKPYVSPGLILKRVDELRMFYIIMIYAHRCVTCTQICLYAMLCYVMLCDGMLRYAMLRLNVCMYIHVYTCVYIYIYIQTYIHRFRHDVLLKHIHTHMSVSQNGCTPRRPSH